jgi:uncharacterized protein
MDRFGLTEQTISSLRSIFLAQPKIEEVILYGSRAKGNYHAGSDIDITLKGESLEFGDLLKIENLIDDLLLPYKVDLSLFHKIENPDFIDHINRVGVPFN